MDWMKTKENASSGSHKRAELPAGQHVVTVSRVTTKMKDGSSITTKGGDPVIIVSLENHEGEIGFFAPLTGEQAWKFESIVAACCSDRELEEMTRSGLEPRNFLADAICRTYLVGKTVIATGKRRGDFVNWYFRSDDGPATNTSARDAEDVPF